MFLLDENLIMIFQPFVPWPLHSHWPKFGIPGNAEIFSGSSLSIFPCNLAHICPVHRKELQEISKG